jgi:hypothetical protein
MKYITVTLMLILSAATVSLAEDGLLVRYSDPSGSMSLTVSHDITVRVDTPVHAGRNFIYDLSVAADKSSRVATVTIDSAKGDYTAHEQKQRLSTRSLTGKSFPLAIGDDGRQLKPTEAVEGIEIGLGPATDPGFSIAGVLADTLPILPQESVSIGTTWTTERSIRSLEGWTWTTGTLVSRHRVTAVDRRDGRTIVTAETEAQADLGPVEGGKECSGDLKRTLRWTFDATEGRLLSLSMEQETEGTTTVPQGHLPIHQVTRVELVRS